MAIVDNAELDLIFGKDSQGENAEERARSSARLFVRSQDQLSEYTGPETGRRFSAWEALQTFGIKVLREVVEHGSAILPLTADEPAKTLRTRRENLGFSEDELSKITGLKKIDIKDAEDPKTKTHIRIIERIAQALALNEHKITFVPQADGDERLAYRLRDLRSSAQPASHTTSYKLVSQLCEAAWVIKKQYELNRWLYSSQPNINFEPSPNYGNQSYPAWQHGYYLARETRKRLNIPAYDPIESLRKLTEEILGIAVVQLALHHTLAGATIANGDERGIGVNVVGANANVWVRRMTLAHELGHLLWDPKENLKNLQVDSYSDLEQAPWQQHINYIEQRANAFAVEFLAPQEAVVRIFQKDMSSGLRLVMETFGLSYTSAKYHIWNALERKIQLEDLFVDDYYPTADWMGRESFTVDFFKPASVPFSRRGLFASLVVKAEENKLITDETASTYLSCTIDEYNTNKAFIREIFE
jgi:Zn-dependent peptidase ImmA (M78 family)